MVLELCEDLEMNGNDWLDSNGPICFCCASSWYFDLPIHAVQNKCCRCAQYYVLCFPKCFFLLTIFKYTERKKSNEGIT